MKVFKLILEDIETKDTHNQRMRAVQSPDIPFSVLRKLVDRSNLRSNNATDEDRKNNLQLRLAAAKNPKSSKFDDGVHTTSLHHKILDADNNLPGTYKHIARAHRLEDGGAAKRIFDRMSEHSDGNARVAVADSYPHEYHDRLKNDISHKVHASLAKEFPENYNNEHAPLSARMIAGMSLHGHHNDLEDHIDKMPLEIKRYVARYTKRYATMDHIVNNEVHPRVREALSRNPNALKNHLRSLANDPDKKTTKLAIDNMATQSTKRFYPKEE